MHPPSDPAFETRVRARVGSTLKDKYRLDRLLGVGGMAAVYAATHRNKKRFAVKVLHPELSADPDLRARFLREGYVANSVGHAGAVAVLDEDVSDDGAAFLVMELLEGETLEAMRRRFGGRVPLRTVLGVASQVLEVLAAAHEQAIVHRDIKPANLFLTTEGRVKLLDFGVARLRDPSTASASVSGLAVGTPAFMSPEQALGRKDGVDARSDLWSLGATMFTLLTGARVHEGKSWTQLTVAAATTAARSLAEVAPETPARVVAIVDRALAFAREERWPNARAMREAITAAFVEAAAAPEGALASVPRMPSRVGPDSAPTARVAARQVAEDEVKALLAGGGRAEDVTRDAAASPEGGADAKGVVASDVRPAPARGERAPSGTPARSRVVTIAVVLLVATVIAVIAVALARGGHR
jgi:serine/threonine-protein kinase